MSALVRLNICNGHVLQCRTSALEVRQRGHGLLPPQLRLWPAGQRQSRRWIAGNGREIPRGGVRAFAGVVSCCLVAQHGCRRCLTARGARSQTTSPSRAAASNSGSVAPGKQDGSLQDPAGGQVSSASRRAARRAEYEELKQQTLLDTAFIGVGGGLLSFFNSGVQAGEGFLLGAAAGALYFLLLFRDVDSLGTPGSPTPLDATNPFRLARLLVPALLLLFLAQGALFSTGVESWLADMRWEPGRNFQGFVSSPETLYTALLGYVVSTASLQLRGIARAVPEVGSIVQALPGSMGVALRLKDDADQKQSQKKASKAPGESSGVPVPVLLVSGPRGCGKSTLVQRLRKADPRLREPEWVVTATGGAVPDGASQRIVTEEQFESLSKSGDLAVCYKPYGDDGEQMGLGLPAIEVLAAAMESGVAVLDVDAPTARAFFSYDWEKALLSASPDRGLQLRVVAVWVSCGSLDALLERNEASLVAATGGNADAAAVQRQLAPLRSQATADMEWALTSGHFEFTIVNKDVKKAVGELRNAARYCFSDPF